MTEFPGNSNKQKRESAPAPAEKKDIQKVISGTAVRRKKTLGTRFREFFLTGEDSRSVFEYMMTEHIKPGFKDIVFDAVTGGLERKMYHDTPVGYHRRRSPASSVATSLLTNYTAMSRGPAGGAIQDEPRLSRRARAQHNFGEIILPTKPEAELVLETMYEIIGRHDECTVADLLQMVGETPQFTDEKWGWTHLEGSRPVRHSGGGYVLALPPTESLA